MVSGVVLMAAGADLEVAQPAAEAPNFGLFVLFGGPVLFLIGRALYAATLYGFVRWRLPIGVVLLVAIAPGIRDQPSIAVFGTIIGVMLLLAFVPGLGQRAPGTDQVMARI